MRSIVVLEGDGIGPEVMDATLTVLDRLDLGLSFLTRPAGVSALDTHGELLPACTLDAIAAHKVALKGPLMTPVGDGFTSLNVGLRRHFDLYANVRPAVTFPNSGARFADVDLVVIRENTEGLYIGDGQQLSDDGQTATAVSRITRAGAERIARYAYELASATGRRRVTIVHKANILKSTSGLFRNTALDVAGDYPHLHVDDLIVDNACMQLVRQPESFDVIVTTNLFGDIISDLCAGLVGGLGLIPGANIGADAAIFEAVHGTAPDIAGQNLANPTALLLAAAQMLDHLAAHDDAAQLRTAITDVLADGRTLTGDLGGTATTATFAAAVAARI